MLENATFRKRGLFPSARNGRKRRTALASRRKNQWLRLALSKGPNRASVSFPPSEDGNRSNFRKVVFAIMYNSGRWTKSINPVIMSVIQHGQNPLHSISHKHVWNLLGTRAKHKHDHEWTGRAELDGRQGQSTFPSSTLSRLAFGANQLYYLSCSGGYFYGLKRGGGR
jgi:hypothetical protein